MKNLCRAFHGSIAHAISNTEVEYLDNALLVISGWGQIDYFEKKIPRNKVIDFLEESELLKSVEVIFLARGDFLMPGFIDTHTHAVQFPNMGLGQQYELLDWLQKVTFPRERKFSDEDYATRTFVKVVQRLINLGTTTCAYYSSIHLEASKILANICYEKGQRAFVGKCNMDRHAIPAYQEKNAAKSLEDTKEFIRYVRTELSKPYDPVSPSPSTSSASSSTNLKTHSRGGSSISRTATPEALSSLVHPILTPRFAISCSDALMTGLSALVCQEPNLHIQTHLAENPSEVEFTKSLFPFADSYTHVYDHFDLLTPRTILAHCVHLEAEEMKLIAKRKAGIAHCPTSNFNLRSGASPVGALLDYGIKVGLGTDVSGGFGGGILSAVREASVSAKVVAMAQRDRELDGRSSSRGRSMTPIGGNKPTKLSASTDSRDGSKIKAEAESVGGDNTLRISVDGTEITAQPQPQSPRQSEPEPFSDRHLSIATLFWLATLGGAEVCTLDDRIGNFEVGKEFDALLIQTGQDGLLSDGEGKPKAPSGVRLVQPEPYEDGLNPSFYAEVDDELPNLVEKFLFSGDDRNIGSVFVRGRCIGGTRPIAPLM